MQIEEGLRARIDQLEKRQTQDDAVINVIHRCVTLVNWKKMEILIFIFL